jgi:hypothetical protein
MPQHEGCRLQMHGGRADRRVGLLIAAGLAVYFEAC